MVMSDWEICDLFLWFDVFMEQVGCVFERKYLV